MHLIVAVYYPCAGWTKEGPYRRQSLNQFPSWAAPNVSSSRSVLLLYGSTMQKWCRRLRILCLLVNRKKARRNRNWKDVKKRYPLLKKECLIQYVSQRETVFFHCLLPDTYWLWGSCPRTRKINLEGSRAVEVLLISYWLFFLIHCS